ncbi:MAG TPA: glycoside hydrolase family 16 protein [Steroidobacteraceae bacterium]|nr:glycoside hydrolase family 16 protein [Steroidobacteraceae bacterium]
MRVASTGGLLVLLAYLAGCTATISASETTMNGGSDAERPAPRKGPPPTLVPVLFDDFNYTSPREFERNGWIMRTAPGWPGVEGALWSGNVTLGVEDPEHPGNYVLRMTATTDGTTTRQAQFCHQRKYYEGTFAARARFHDAPASGPDGDQVVETFYFISPLKAPLDPDYSEIDFEYLPNGGWGGGPLTLYVTTWETFRPEPEWLQINTSRAVQGSREGWHTVVAQVAAHTVNYYVDGELLATHGEPYYPEVPMSINFNLWFIKGGLAASGESRRYVEDIDWVFHQKDAVVAPARVEELVKEMRHAGVTFRDTVPAMNPPLSSPCNF